MERDAPAETYQTSMVISTHTLTWSVTVRRAAPPAIGAISTHTLTWSVTWTLIILVLNPVNFNSHAHVERDVDVSNFVQCLLVISTHTLTWSVTSAGEDIQAALCISTHTLTWSVTLDVVYIWCLLNVMRTYFFI